jgi:hypothetical protein
MKQVTLSFSLTLLFVALGYIILQNPRPSRAQANQTDSAACCGPTHPILPRELDFPYYSLQNGFGSTLNLVSDSLGPRSLRNDVDGSEDDHPTAGEASD